MTPRRSDRMPAMLADRRAVEARRASWIEWADARGFAVSEKGRLLVRTDAGAALSIKTAIVAGSVVVRWDRSLPRAIEWSCRREGDGLSFDPPDAPTLGFSGELPLARALFGAAPTLTRACSTPNAAIYELTRATQPSDLDRIWDRLREIALPRVDAYR